MSRGAAGAWTRWVAALASIAACTEPGTGDPLADSFDVALPAAARAFAAVHDGDVTSVALALEVESEVLVLQGNAAGELSLGDRVAVGQGPRWLAAADFDGDGRDELVTANAGDSGLSVLGRSAAQPWELRTSVPMAAPPTRVESADFDGDGTLDLIVILGLGDEAAIEVWHGLDPGFERRVEPLAAPAISSLAVGDLDGDGRPDAVAVTSTADEVTLMINDGTGRLVPLATVAGCTTPLAASIADLDGDGRADVAVACREGGFFLVYDAADERRVQAVTYAGNLSDAIARDLDGDGDVDLAAVDVAGHVVGLWLRASGGYCEPTLHPVGRGPIAIRAADLEHDGDLDLLVLSFDEQSLSVLMNTSSPAQEMSECDE